MPEMPLSSTRASLPRDADRETDLDYGHGTLRVDFPTGDHRAATGPTPVDLLTGSLAACSVMSARTFLERDGDLGDVSVTVTLDAGPPTQFFRTVTVSCDLADDRIHRLIDALERTEVTSMLRPSYMITTRVHTAPPTDHP